MYPLLSFSHIDVSGDTGMQINSEFVAVVLWFWIPEPEMLKGEEG